MANETKIICNKSVCKNLVHFDVAAADEANSDAAERATCNMPHCSNCNFNSCNNNTNKEVKMKEDAANCSQHAAKRSFAAPTSLPLDLSLFPLSNSLYMNYSTSRYPVEIATVVICSCNCYRKSASAKYLGLCSQSLSMSCSTNRYPTQKTHVNRHVTQTKEAFGKAYTLSEYL